MPSSARLTPDPPPLPPHRRMSQVQAVIWKQLASERLLPVSQNTAHYRRRGHFRTGLSSSPGRAQKESLKRIFNAGSTKLLTTSQTTTSLPVSFIIQRQTAPTVQRSKGHADGAEWVDAVFLGVVLDSSFLSSVSEGRFHLQEAAVVQSPRAGPGGPAGPAKDSIGGDKQQNLSPGAAEVGPAGR